MVASKRCGTSVTRSSPSVGFSTKTSGSECGCSQANKYEELIRPSTEYLMDNFTIVPYTGRPFRQHPPTDVPINCDKYHIKILTNYVSNLCIICVPAREINIWIWNTWLWSCCISHTFTMSHWSSGLTVCFPSQGSAVCARGDATHTLELGSPVSTVSLHDFCKK